MSLTATLQKIIAEENAPLAIVVPAPPANIDRAFILSAATIEIIDGRRNHSESRVIATAAIEAIEALGFEIKRKAAT